MDQKGRKHPRQDKDVRRVKFKRPPERLYYSISEVAEMLDVKPYVLRFWEKEFSSLRPKKNRAGNRVYQKKDIAQVEQIRDLLYTENYTIIGARRQLKYLKKKSTATAAKTTDADLGAVRRELGAIREEVEGLIELFS